MSDSKISRNRWTNNKRQAFIEDARRGMKHEDLARHYNTDMDDVVRRLKSYGVLTGEMESSEIKGIQALPEMGATLAKETTIEDLASIGSKALYEALRVAEERERITNAKNACRELLEEHANALGFTITHIELEIARGRR